MRKTIVPIIIFACAAVLFCGCEGKKGTGKTNSIHDVSESEASYTDGIPEGSSEVSVITGESNSADAESTTTVYEDVEAGGEAEYIDSSASSSVSSSEETDSSEDLSSSTESGLKEEDSSKDSMSGWSAWQ